MQKAAWEVGSIPTERLYRWRNWQTRGTPVGALRLEAALNCRFDSCPVYLLACRPEPRVRDVRVAIAL